MGTEVILLLSCEEEEDEEGGRELRSEEAGLRLSLLLLEREEMAE
jgi:hypothetical protein